MREQSMTDEALYLVFCAVKLNANRRVTGVLRGFDQFMNLVLDNTVEEISATERVEIGMVVIRGSSPDNKFVPSL
jgi:hypothetical protein